MLYAALKGFLFMGGLIIAIGAQNAFLLRQGLKQEFVLPLVIFCAFTDALLATVGVLGLGFLLEKMPALLLVLKWGGVIFLFCYGIFAFARALKPKNMDVEGEGQSEFMPVMLTIAALTFFNPHVYLDTVILVGALANQYSEPDKYIFLMGCIIASFTWFFCLGYGARLLKPLFQKKQAWQILDFCIGVIMILLGLSLAAS